MAQSGERRVRIAKVGGSNPPISTKILCMGYVYILHSIPTGRFYIGSTIDISVRIYRHNAGHHPSTKPYRPWILVFSESFNTLVEARKRERQIKAWKNPSYMVKTLGIKF